jgi:hypothetical protein
MDKDILKLLPQKAFKLLSIKETFRIGATVTKSMLDKNSYQSQFEKRKAHWHWNDIKLTQVTNQAAPITKLEDGERILRIYFEQLFNNELAVHLDLRSNHFSSTDVFIWNPSKIHYTFSSDFRNGVQSLYLGFYQDDDELFEKGLKLLGMIRDSMGEDQQTEVKSLFYKHFGEGKTGTVKFSLSKLQSSFDAIFSFFLREDIPLNPEFAVLGINLVTMYLTLEKLPHSINVSEVFFKVVAGKEKV